MPLRSHVDPCFAVRFMHVRADTIPEDIARSLQQAGDRDVAKLACAYDQNFARNPRTLFHEAYHFWQALRLPFLYRYATLGFSQYFLAFRQLARQTKDYEKWDCTIPALYRLELEGYLWGHPGDAAGFSYSKSADSGPTGRSAPSISTTPLALMENAATVAEFEVLGEGQGPSDPVAFKRWTKKFPAYTEVLSYVSRVLQDERLTLLAFTPMVNAAFQTTDPVRAFALLLNSLHSQLSSAHNRQTASTSQNVLAWSRLMEDMLGGLPYDAAEDEDADILTPKFFRLSRETWLSGYYGKSDSGVLEHPMLPVPARLWEEAAKFPEMQFAIDHPGYLTGRQRDLIISKFFPPLTVASFHFDDGTNRVVTWGNVDLLSDFFGKRGFNVVDLFSIYSTVRRASGAHFDPEQRTCHWTACPHYRPNFCNSFPGVPRSGFRDCTFPKVTSELVQLIGNMQGGRDGSDNVLGS